MFIHSKLVILVLVLTLGGQVHAGEIIGGNESAAHSRPYMVILEQRTYKDEKKHCDGFLLNEDFVMTAAHCQAKSYTVLLGVHNVHKHNEIQRVPVKEAFPHKDYHAADYKNDIMLLKLSSKVNFSTTVKPIDLADQSDGSLPKSCLVCGWGSTENSKYMSLKLREVNVTLIDDEQCPKEHSYCSEGENGPGPGDSGGPLVCEDGKAYGVVSSGMKPKPGAPIIYAFAKIPDYTEWINSTMEHHGMKHVTIA